MFIVDYCQYISLADHQYLKQTHTPDDPFAYVCILTKVHKCPWCSCPIVSCSGLLCHGLGKWLDQELQPIIKCLPSYLPSSTTLNIVWILSTWISHVSPCLHVMLSQCISISQWIMP